MYFRMLRLEVMINRKRLGLLILAGVGVALSAKKVNVKAGEKNVAFEALMTIAQPKRWDVDSPYLYKVYSRLKNKKGEVLTALLIRWEFVNIILMRRKVFS